MSCVASLGDFTLGVSEIMRGGKITHYLPFISSVAVDNDEPNGAHIIETSPVGKVKVVMQKARSAVRYKRVKPTPYDGAGVTVAVIDTGLSPHIDFMLPNRVPLFIDFQQGKTEPYDDNGHGTCVAGALAGNGLLSNGEYAGMASGARIIPIKALGASGEGTTADILQAMQWVWSNAKKYDIKVLCTSFGAEPQENDPLAKGAKALHDVGVTVVASSGNEGPSSGTVKSPGISPFVITVGGANVQGAPSVSSFSSWGRIRGIMKPDVVAPAEGVVCASREGYVAVSGTSIAAPIVAGACALLLSEHPTYSPDKVKEEIMKNARYVGESGGAGMIDFSSS